MNTWSRFALSADLGNGLDNEAHDVEAAKRGLFQLGYYSPPDFGFTGILDRDLDEGLRNFQQDRALKVDVLARPGGETEAALDEGKLWIVNNRVANIRELAMEEIMANDPTQEGHRDGWLARTRSFSVSTHPGMPLHWNWPLK